MKTFFKVTLYSILVKLLLYADVPVMTYTQNVKTPLQALLDKYQSKVDAWRQEQNTVGREHVLYHQMLDNNVSLLSEIIDDLKKL